MSDLKLKYGIAKGWLSKDEIINQGGLVEVLRVTYYRYGRGNGIGYVHGDGPVYNEWGHLEELFETIEGDV